MSSKDDPYVRMKSEHFSVVFNVELDCMHTVNTVKQWDATFTNNGGSDTILTRGNVDIFEHLPRTLPYGYISLEHYVHMAPAEGTLFANGLSQDYNIEHAWTRTMGYLHIIKTPLVAALMNASYKWIEPYNRSIHINAVNSSFDLDVEPDDKSGLGFKWFCRKLTELLDLSSAGVIAIPDYQSIPGSDGGCFGTGIGEIGNSNDEGWIEVDSWYMTPNTEYMVEMILSKDDRTALANQTILVTSANAPSVNVM